MSPRGKPKSSKPGPKVYALVSSNALNASSRSLSDIALDYIAVAILSLSATNIGLLNALQALFFTLLSVPIGIYLDRKPGAQLARLAGTLKAATLSLVMCALALGSLHISHLLAASIIFGTCATANENSQTRLIPLATTKTTSLASKLEAADSFTTLTLPALGGFLLTGLGASPTLALAAACSLPPQPQRARRTKNLNPVRLYNSASSPSSSKMPVRAGQNCGALPHSSKLP